MTSDRELLELAAKAAGLPVEFDSPVNDWYPCGYDDNGDVAHWWNPLKDDGDCFRLAAALQIDVWHRPGHIGAGHPYKGLIRSYEAENTGRATATRRAIVRAAAAIGGA